MVVWKVGRRVGKRGGREAERWVVWRAARRAWRAACEKAALMVCLEVEMRAEQKESLLVVEMAAVKDGLKVG